MEDQYQQSMIDDKKTIKRICKAIEKMHGVKLTPCYFSDNSLCFVKDNKEVIRFNCNFNGDHLLDNKVLIEFLASSKRFLEFVINPNSIMFISNDLSIHTSEIFGTSFEEMNINLELLDV